ncbi:chemotaxis protein CheW [Haliangium sp.]|uniref:chemotaxis protein CheW n=1 Tax=Haliangium sp. TaxID=2663208 RepID=UPI003D127AEB
MVTGAGPHETTDDSLADDSSPDSSPDSAVERAETGAGVGKYVCFRLRGQELAVAIEAVKETLAVPPLTRVFLTPPCFAGIINLRGDIVAVLDLAWLLGLGATAVSEATRVVICRGRDRDGDGPGRLEAGVLVDALTELRSFDRAGIAPAPPTLTAAGAGLLAGLATADDGTPLQVLDVDRLLGSEQVRVFQREAH